MSDKKLYMIPCLPLKDFPNKAEAEKEQPGLEAMACPECHKMMWISAKKREIIRKPPGEFRLACWHCIKRMANEMVDDEAVCVKNIENLQI